MRTDEKKAANDHQIKLYFTYYDRFWRLHKLISLRETLKDRERLQSVYRDFYGEGYFEYEHLAYQNITNGILADALSETVMYCEDYLSLLKFIREKLFFVKHTVSYSAGIVSNIASKLRAINHSQASRLFLLPSKDIIQISFARNNAGTAHSAIKTFSDGIDRLITIHESTIRFFERHRDHHIQYKHGLKLCLNGLGGKLADDEFMRRKQEYSGTVFVLQNKLAQEAYKSGGIMIPDISHSHIRNNLTTMFAERNLLHLEALDINIDHLIETAKGISRMLNIIVANRISLIDHASSKRIVVNLPGQNSERLTSFSYTFDLFADQKLPTIDDYQLKL